MANFFLPKWLERVETSLRDAVAAMRSDCRCATRLVAAMEYSLMAPGKRIRPLLVILAAKCTAERAGREFDDSLPIDTTANRFETRSTSFYAPSISCCAESRLCSSGDALAGDKSPSRSPGDLVYADLLYAAVAVEMVHAYSLIHDDLPAMDNDDLRRGLPTNHRMFDEATAILAGDALQPMAFEQLVKIHVPEKAAEACRILARAIGAAGMVGGQMRDVGFEKRLPEYREMATQSSEKRQEFLEQVHRGKTGALIGASLELGALLAGASREDRAAFLQFAEWMGRLYQITDDLLDLSSDADTLGKAVRKDAALGKLTYPGLLGVSGASQEADRCAAEAEQIASQFHGDGGAMLRKLIQAWRGREK